MKTLFLLVVLSQNAAGDINASFVNTETLDQCRQKALMVEDIFNTAGIPVLESRCIASELKFSAYGHEASSSKARNFYLLEFDDTSVHITAVSGWSSCMQQKKSAGSQERMYCGSSVQSML